MQSNPLPAGGWLGYIVKRAKRAQRRESWGVECTRHYSRHRIYYIRHVFVTTDSHWLCLLKQSVQFCGSNGRGSPNCRCYWSEVRTATLGEANEPKQNKPNLLILIRRYCCLMQWSTAVVETIKGRDEGEPIQRG